MFTSRVGGVEGCCDLWLPHVPISAVLNIVRLVWLVVARQKCHLMRRKWKPGKKTMGARHRPARG